MPGPGKPPSVAQKIRYLGTELTNTLYSFRSHLESFYEDDRANNAQFPGTRQMLDSLMKTMTRLDSYLTAYYCLRERGLFEFPPVISDIERFADLLSQLSLISSDDTVRILMSGEHRVYYRILQRRCSCLGLIPSSDGSLSD
jgi:hypothetical protein